MSLMFRVGRGSVCSLLAWIGAGCLTTPVAPLEPTTKSSFTASVGSSNIKLDVLFAIDDSGSMGDKQALLAEAVPDLLGRLLVPNCVDPTDEKRVLGKSKAGVCAQGVVEFPPILDLHVGIVTSSVFCPGGVTTSGLVTKVQPGSSADSLAPRGFLNFFPNSDGAVNQADLPPDAISDENTFLAAFRDLVKGVGESGCGYEGTQESWYRFLVEPDPYAESGLLPDGRWGFRGADPTILKQRKEFLRPDSLVLVVQVTDENESTPDPRSLSGQGYRYSTAAMPLPVPTSSCASNPLSTDCGACTDPAHSARSECKTPERRTNDTNLSFFHTKKRHGQDPMYPLARYIRALGVDPQSGRPLATPKVPSTASAHPSTEGAYGDYADVETCTNPLFAKALPEGQGEELCRLEPGPRGPGQVFFATITGVPHQLLHFDPNDPAKSRLSEDDWTKILGKAPLAYDFTGADPHMLESTELRPGLPIFATNRVDPIHGGEFTTSNEVQYACIFPLSKSRDCSGKKASNCDCSAGEKSPVCDPVQPKIQTHAKAYPGVRHLALAKALGAQAVVSSICPEDTSDGSPSNARYGYRPAAKATVDRLKDSLRNTCLPRPLKVDSTTGAVPCVVLSVLPEQGSSAACNRPDAGLSVPNADVLSGFLAAKRQEDPLFAADLAKHPICELASLPVAAGQSCASSAEAGWCYVTGAAAKAETSGACSELISFSPSGRPSNGGRIYLQCIQESESRSSTLP